MDAQDPSEEEQEKLATALSTARTDTSVPDAEWPQVPGDTGILIGSEAATIARNEALAEGGAEPDSSPTGSSTANAAIVRPRRRRGSLRRR